MEINHSMMPKKAKKNPIISLLIAMCLLFNSICLLANEVITISDFGDKLIIGIVGIGAFVCLFDFRIHVKAMGINIFVLVLILISFAFYDFNLDIQMLLINYIVWGIFVALFLMQEYSMRLVLDIALFFSATTLVVDLIYQRDYEAMTWSYAVFPCMAVSMAHFVFFRKEAMFIFKLMYIPCLLMFFRYLSEANRGALVSLIMLIYLLVIKTPNTQTMTMRNKKALNVFFIILIAVALIFYEEIITFLYNIIEKYDIDLYAIKKMYRGIREDNITNNRDELYSYAWNGFLSSPLFGHGVGGFSVNHGGWPHNFILQILYEGGLILFSAIIIPLVRIIYFFITDEKVSIEDYVLFVCFFSTSIPRLLFSTEVWNTQGFWMLFVFGYMCIEKYNMLKVKEELS